MTSSTRPARTLSARRRERQKEETRERILVAARELFARHGVEATTMRAIATRIEYTPTAIYHHFRDKQALLQELCHHDFRALAQALVRIGQIADPVERVRRMGYAYTDFALNNRSQYQFMFMTSHEHELMDPMLLGKGNPEEDAYGFLVQTVTEGLNAGRFRDEFTDEHALAQVLWGSLHGLIALHLTKGNDPWVDWRDPVSTVHLAIDATLRGTLRDPASLAP